MKMKLAAMTALLVFFWTGSLLGNDAIAASVSIPEGCPIPDAPVYNGNAYSSGTYAIGTIQLLFVVTGSTFPAGYFGCFDLGLENVRVNQNNTPQYPVTLGLRQTGSANLALTPTTTSFSVTDLGEIDQTPVRVGITIPANVPGDPLLNEDGDELVANLQLETAPRGSKLGTVTTVQVKIKLVHPSFCLRTYQFVLNNDNAEQLASLDLVTKNGKSTPVVNASNPGTILDAVLLVNTCSNEQTFDLKLLPSEFLGLQGANAVSTYTRVGASGLSDFIPLIGATKGGVGLCLPDLILPGNTAMLTTALMQVNKNTPVADLPSSSQFAFSAELRDPGQSCGGELISSALVDPNPASTSLPFTTK